jgi:hypothetical protein
MATRYDVADKETLELLEEVKDKYHERLVDNDVQIGVLMAYAEVDEKSGKRKGVALKGYAGAQAAAKISNVPLKDRLTKKYDVELVIDGDHWPDRSEAEKRALLDHELTHIVPKDKTDDLGRPIITMRDEDFIVWGFLQVVERHGAAALEARSVKALIDQHGQLLLGMEGVA